MKSLYESLLTGKVSKPSAKVQPRSKKELQQLIDEHIKEIKPRPGQEVDLNWIDISRVDDLSELFMYTEYVPVIDKWKIDHVENFACMFAGNEYIIHSPLPVLQEKLLFHGCYDKMFFGCTALKEPPALPAMKLTRWCYYAMFGRCSSLKVAPELPVTNLAPYCYRSMFEKCSSLKVAPDLPSTNLARGCYSSMFEDCSKLETKAKVPAEVNMNDTYYTYNMYAGCTNIKD